MKGSDSGELWLQAARRETHAVRNRRDWDIPFLRCSNGKPCSYHFALARHSTRPRMGAQSKGLSATLSFRRQGRDSISLAECSTSHIRNRVVPSSAVGMETGSSNYRDPSPRRHHQPRQRRLAARGNRSHNRRSIVDIPFVAPNQSGIFGHD